ARAPRAQVRCTHPRSEPAQVERAVRILDEYNELVHEGRVLDNGAVKALLRVVTEEPNISLRGILQPGRPRAFGKKSITPKSANQRRYMEFIERYDMVFAIGPGGTGKTYLDRKSTRLNSS